MAGREHQRFGERFALRGAEALFGNPQRCDFQERRRGFVPARRGVFDRHAVPVQLYADIEAGLVCIQMLLHRVAEVGLARRFEHPAAVTRCGYERILHRTTVAEAVRRGAPIADIQRGSRANAQRGQSKQCARVPAQHAFGGEQQRRTFDDVVHRVAEQRDCAEGHRWRTQQDEILTQRGLVFARSAGRHQLDRKAARIADGVRLRLAAGIGGADPACIRLRFCEQTDAQVLRQIALHFKTPTQ